MTETEHAQWIRQFWLDKSDEMKSDLNEAVRIAYEQGRKDALEEVRAEIEKVMNSERIFDTNNARAQYIALGWCTELIDKYKGVKE